MEERRAGLTPLQSNMDAQRDVSAINKLLRDALHGFQTGNARFPAQRARYSAPFRAICC
jgi:hypothetical protein